MARKRKISHNAQPEKEKKNRELHLEMCMKAGKAKHKRIKHALTIANTQSQIHGVKFTIYVCDHCGHYHLTTEGKRKNLKDNLDLVTRLLQEKEQLNQPV